MNIIQLTASVSRNAGGLFDVVKKLSISLQFQHKVNIKVYGIDDKYTADDISSWQPLRPITYKKIGPSSFAYTPGLLKSLLHTGAEIIHNHGLWMYPSLAVLKWYRQTQKPYVVSPQGMLDLWALQNARWKKRVASVLYENAHLQNAACIHAVSRQELDAIRNYGLKNPVCVIPNGVNIPVTGNKLCAPWSDEKVNGERVLLFLGRLHPKKGLPNLVKAWKCIGKEKRSKWKLIIAGWDQGGHRKILEQMISEFDLGHEIKFTGPLYGEDKAAALSHADAFILPSFSEGLPVSVLEAWSYGLPVVMTPQCNIPEGFDTGAAISVYPETKSIEDGLFKLFEMRNEELNTVGQKGRSLVEEKFTWKRIARDMRSVYEWVIGSRSIPDWVHII
jgi:glycosyltransferase involved in cell wall biosynthesis